MWSSYDEFITFLGGRRWYGLPEPNTKIRIPFMGNEWVYELQWHGQPLLTYHPTHIELNYPWISSKHGDNYRKKINQYLPATMKISNKQGKPYIVDFLGNYHGIVKGMIFDWTGAVIKPFIYRGSLWQYVDTLYTALENGDTSYFVRNECFTCSSMLNKKPLSHALGCEYHFHDHLADRDVSLATIGEMCELYWDENTGPSTVEGWIKQEIRLGIAGERDLDSGDFGLMSNAYRWFIKEMMGIDVEDM